MQPWSQFLARRGDVILKGTAPLPLVEMASRGLAPLPPTDVLVVLVFLAEGEDAFTRKRRRSAQSPAVQNRNQCS